MLPGIKAAWPYEVKANRRSELFPDPSTLLALAWLGRVVLDKHEAKDRRPPLTGATARVRLRLSSRGETNRDGRKKKRKKTATIAWLIIFLRCFFLFVQIVLVRGDFLWKCEEARKKLSRCVR